MSLTESVKGDQGLPQFSLEQGTFLTNCPPALQFVILFPLVLVVHPRTGSIQSVKPSLCVWQSPRKRVFKNFAWTRTVRSLAAAFGVQRSFSLIFRMCVHFIFSYQDYFFLGSLIIFILVLLGICKSNTYYQYLGRLLRSLNTWRE